MKAAARRPPLKTFDVAAETYFAMPSALLAAITKSLV